MKVTDNTNYGDYLKTRSVGFFSDKKNYTSIGIPILFVGLLWYIGGFWETLKLATTLTNGMAITFLVYEVVRTTIRKEIKRNKYITCILIIGISTIINRVCFSIRDLYFSIAMGFVFVITGLIGLAFVKIISRRGESSRNDNLKEN